MIIITVVSVCNRSVNMHCERPLTILGIELNGMPDSLWPDANIDILSLLPLVAIVVIAQIAMTDILFFSFQMSTSACINYHAK